jgi:hypothetical protein
VQNGGEPLPWSQGTPVAAHLPADALRVLRGDGPDGDGGEAVSPGNGGPPPGGSGD